MRRLAPLLLAVLVVAGCGHSAKTTHEVSPKQLARLPVGSSKDDVRHVLGKPDVFHRIPYPTPGEMDEGFEDCWDYGTPSLTTSMVELCFWNGKLSSRARYGGA